MTPDQYRTAIKALGLSQERAGEMLGIAPRTSQGYALGEYPVPEPVAKLLEAYDRITTLEAELDAFRKIIAQLTEQVMSLLNPYVRPAIDGDEM